MPNYTTTSAPYIRRYLGTLGRYIPTQLNEDLDYMMHVSCGMGSELVVRLPREFMSRNLTLGTTPENPQLVDSGGKSPWCNGIWQGTVLERMIHKVAVDVQCKIMQNYKTLFLSIL